MKTITMNIKIRFTVAVVLCLIVSAAFSTNVFAHHSFAAQYDRNKPNTITGPVTKVEWINPHARFFVDAKDANGKVVNWEVELGPPAMLMRQGWMRTSLKIGDMVTVDGFLAKDGSNLTNARTVTLSDGKKVFAGSSLDEQQPNK
jgi:uncharacterized protein DUF6152